MKLHANQTKLLVCTFNKDTIKLRDGLLTALLPGNQRQLRERAECDHVSVRSGVGPPAVEESGAQVLLRHLARRCPHNQPDTSVESSLP